MRDSNVSKNQRITSLGVSMPLPVMIIVLYEDRASGVEYIAVCLPTISSFLEVVFLKRLVVGSPARLLSSIERHGYAYWVCQNHNVFLDQIERRKCSTANRPSSLSD